jgi:hypothetical protein
MTQQDKLPSFASREHTEALVNPLSAALKFTVTGESGAETSRHDVTCDDETWPV